MQYYPCPRNKCNVQRQLFFNYHDVNVIVFVSYQISTVYLYNFTHEII